MQDKNRHPVIPFLSKTHYRGQAESRMRQTDRQHHTRANRRGVRVRLKEVARSWQDRELQGGE